MLEQLFAGEQEDAILTVLEAQPGERHVRPGVFYVLLTVADFDDQNALGFQMLRGLTQDAAHDVEAVLARFKRYARFML
ncbi:MAG: hypothetical protein ACPL3S_02920, partial [Halothiobacillaceae bacterium]